MKRVDWTEPAESDLQAIDDYWCGHSVERADQMLETIRKAGDFLAGLPKAGPALEKDDARKWSVGGTNYILIYRLAGDSVQILRVHHSQEDWPKLP